jgi:undecaprenyl-diphosphatase
MLELINKLDVSIILGINGLNNPWLDAIMWFVSKTFVWVPFYLLLVFFIIKKYRKNGLWFLLAIGLTIALSDQLSSGLIKPLVQRLRPSHNPEIAGMLHYVNGYKGGAFGFVSSHAANSFALAFMVSFLFSQRWVCFSMYGWAVIVSLSRIYLGVHYATDVLCGALVGIFSASIVLFLFLKYIPALKNYRTCKPSHSE